MNTYAWISITSHLRSVVGLGVLAEGELVSWGIGDMFSVGLPWGHVSYRASAIRRRLLTVTTTKPPDTDSPLRATRGHMALHPTGRTSEQTYIKCCYRSYSPCACQRPGPRTGRWAS